ncbi:hypothetical protein ABEB36_013807 [Hypothenemus hampei]|uniref:DNA helicase n=1 Tax=Hypothenemus hampei TaxID=57062 RepID=A0ABD1E5C1_HYPHA
MSQVLLRVTKVYDIQAINISIEIKTYGQKPKSEHVPNDPNKTGSLLNKINIGRNQLEPGALPAAVHVKFNDDTIKPDDEINKTVHITPSSVEYDGLRSSGKIIRKMLPFILCWGVTVHKLQGCTSNKAVCN